jgi:hypothetical protein
MLPQYTIRECATLGTNFCDIYRDNELFAREVPIEVGKWAIEYPAIFLGNVGVDIEKMRRWVLEQEYNVFSKCILKK